jgi:mono/diheme cytochrome c family protein
MKRFDERQMRAIISNGKDTMPPFGRRLKPGELAKLIEYLKTL